MSKHPNNKTPDESLYFHRYRRIDGTLEAADMIRRNGRPEVRFEPSIVEFPIYTEAEGSPDYQELVDEVCQNLKDVERRTWLKIIDGRSILDIAKEDSVSRAAIYDRIKRMVEKNPYVAIWWRLKNKKNQHE